MMMIMPSSAQAKWVGIRGFIGAVLTLASIFPIEAQQYHVRGYTVADGLPSGHIRGIAQGSDGRVWFATRSGIAAYDGQEWTTYNLADGLVWADQYALRWDSEGVLWSVGAISPFKLSYLAQENWREVTGPGVLDADLEITSFEILGDGGLGTMAIGTDHAGVLLRERGAWRRLTRTEGLPSNEVRGLVEHQGRLIIGTTAGLVALQGGRLDPAWQPLPADRRSVRGLAKEEDPDGTARLWILGDDWIGTLRDDRFELLAEDLPLDRSAPGPLVATADRRGGLYYGSSEALYHYHPQDGLESIGRANGLLAEGATALFLDREDNLWIGSQQGASKLISRRFARWTTSQGLFDNEVTAVLERRNGDVVLGHLTGLSIVRGTRITTRSLADRAEAVGVAGRQRPERISDMAEDAQGNLWLAAGGLGLGRLRPNGELRWYEAQQGLPGRVTSVLVDSSQQLWAATEDGLSLFQGDIFVPPPGDLPAMRIRRMFEASDGALLLASASGLFRYRAGRWQAWACSEGTACNSIFGVLERDDGNFYVGTAAGLHRTAANTVVRETSPGPQIEAPIYFIVRDAEDRIWFGTDNGVRRWNGARLQHFTVEDGLAGRETYRAAGRVDSRGRVWIGTERGITIYSEGRPGPPREPPIVSLTGLSVGERELPVVAPQRLRPHEDDPTFHFRAISLLDEDRILVSRWLEGYEDDWQAPSPLAQRSISFDNLPPGDYVLHLKAANAEGTWSAAVSSAPLSIAGPFWQRPWFYLLTTAVLLGIGLSIVSHRSQRLYSRQLEAQVEERVHQLMTEKERLTLTLRNIGDGVIATDEKGSVVMLNPTAEEITGWSNAQAVGSPLQKILRLHEPTTTGDLGERLALPGPQRPDIFEEMQTAEVMRQSGERRLVELSGSAMLRSSGRYTGLVLALRDVTERRRFESEVMKGQKLEALGLLAGGIAHDFNNLLTVLLGNLSLLDQGDLPENERQRYLQDAENAVMRARDLTQQLLTFSRGGAPVRKAASISEVIRDSASFVMSGSNVRCEFELPDDLWVVDIDAGQISQVLNNLLINAIQAMPDGGKVRVSGRNIESAPPPLAAGRHIVIDVADQGVGIPENHQQRVFDPYFSTKQEGRGLGLASAYSIAKKHEGLLTVESQPGEGTVFRLYLPASKTQVVEDPESIDIRFDRGGRILIMDDEDAVRYVTGSIVEQLGFEATFAADGREAIERYQRALDGQTPYDAVLMDLTIPGGMGGQEAIAHLRVLDPTVRAVVMSGYSNDPVLASYRDYGFRGVLGKPFKADDLARVLSDTLNEEPVPV